MLGGVAGGRVEWGSSWRWGGAVGDSWRWWGEPGSSLFYFFIFYFFVCFYFFWNVCIVYVIVSIIVFAY